MARSTASGLVKSSCGTDGEFCREEQPFASHDSECYSEDDERTRGSWDVKRQMDNYHNHSEQMVLSSNFKVPADEEDKPHFSLFSSTTPHDTFTISYPPKITAIPRTSTIPQRPPSSPVPPLQTHTLPFNASNSAMLRFVAMKQQQFHRQRLKGRFRKVGAEDILQWTPLTPSQSSTCRLQRVPSVKRDVVRSNDTKTLRLRRQSSNTSSSAYSRYLSAKPLPILRSGSLKKDKHSIRKRLASMNRNKPLPPIPFPFLALDKTEIELEPFDSSLDSSLSLKAVLNESDDKKALSSEIDLIPGKERLKSPSDQIERPNKDENKANPSAEKTQGKNSYYFFGFLLSWPRNTKPNESYHLEPNHHPTAIDTSDKKVETIVNSTVDSTIANLVSINVEATCPSLTSAEVISHPHGHSQNNQSSPSSNINVDTGNKKDKDQDEPRFSKIDDLRLQSPSFKAHSHRLDTFRFPLRRSPLEKPSSIHRPRVFHAHRQSLPPTMSTTSPLFSRSLDLHSLSPSDLGLRSSTAFSVSIVPKEAKNHPKDDTSSPPTKIHLADEARPPDVVRPSMVQRSLSRRSESCSHISHRPTLSLDSSKKALLSLQARRVNKPDAKVVRLPDIKTTTTSSSSVVVLSPSTDVLDTPIGEIFLQGDAILNYHDSDYHNYQLQVSDRDRTVTDALLVDVTTVDAFKEVVSLEMKHSTVEMSVNKKPASLEPSVGLEARSGAPVVDAGEIKRFFKRSHALRELETTEETYVYDLDTLIKVSIFVRTPESRFRRPQNCNAHFFTLILVQLFRC